MYTQSVSSCSVHAQTALAVVQCTHFTDSQAASYAAYAAAAHLKCFLVLQYAICNENSQQAHNATANVYAVTNVDKPRIAMCHILVLVMYAERSVQLVYRMQSGSMRRSCSCLRLLAQRTADHMKK
jgi:hypothetical protein